MAKRQTEIPGTERETIPEIEEIAQPYISALYKRMALQKKELEFKSQLLERMKQSKQKTYIVYDKDDTPFQLSVDAGDPALKVKRLEKPGAEDQE